MSAAFRSVALIAVLVGVAACKPAPEAEAPAPAADASVVAPAVESAAAAPAPAAPASAAADLGQVGELRIGAEFGKAPAHKALVPAGLRQALDGDCEYYSGGSLPAGMIMMVTGDRIQRFDVDYEGDTEVAVQAKPADAPPVPFGLWAGMPVGAAKTLLPAGVKITPHAYVAPDGDYLTWTDKAGKLAIRLETLNGLVTSLYWGQPDAVELIEGCA